MANLQLAQRSLSQIARLAMREAGAAGYALDQLIQGSGTSIRISAGGEEAGPDQQSVTFAVYAAAATRARLRFTFPGPVTNAQRRVLERAARTIEILWA